MNTRQLSNLNCWFDVRQAVKIFPEVRDALLDHTLKHSDKFLGDWFGVMVAMEIFPEARDAALDHILKHSDKFLGDWLSVKTAIEIFPEAKDAVRNYAIYNSDANVQRTDKKFPESANVTPKKLHSNKPQYTLFAISAEQMANSVFGRKRPEGHDDLWLDYTPTYRP